MELSFTYYHQGSEFSRNKKGSAILHKAGTPGYLTAWRCQGFKGF